MVLQSLEGTDILPTFDPRLEAFVSFVNVIQNIPEGIIVNVFDTLLTEVCTYRKY